eukprot:3438036-Pleurochrysis_carterae.AAC.2
MQSLSSAQAVHAVRQQQAATAAATRQAAMAQLTREHRRDCAFLWPAKLPILCFHAELSSVLRLRGEHRPRTLRGMTTTPAAGHDFARCSTYAAAANPTRIFRPDVCS